MNFAEITREYYSLWLGESDLLSRLGAGVHFVPSSERNHAQYGYSVPFQLYAFCQPNRVILSYGDALAEHIDWLKEQPLDGAANVKAAIQAHFSGRIGHSRNYVMSSLPSIKTRSRALTSDDLSHFCSFNGKSCITEDWLCRTWLHSAFAGDISSTVSSSAVPMRRACRIWQTGFKKSASTRCLRTAGAAMPPTSASPQRARSSRRANVPSGLQISITLHRKSWRRGWDLFPSPRSSR